MSKFVIRRTANNRYLTFTPFGKHISGTAHREVETANAEIAGWVAGWNAGIERSPILRWSWNVEDEQIDRSGIGESAVVADDAPITGMGKSDQEGA